MRAFLLALCASAATALRPVHAPPSPAQRPLAGAAEAAKRFSASVLAAGGVAGAQLAPLPAVALSASDYDAIYGMSSTGGQGSSIKLDAPKEAPKQGPSGLTSGLASGRSPASAPRKRVLES